MSHAQGCSRPCNMLFLYHVLTKRIQPQGATSTSLYLFQTVLFMRFGRRKRVSLKHHFDQAADDQISIPTRWVKTSGRKIASGGRPFSWMEISLLECAHIGDFVLSSVLWHRLHKRWDRDTERGGAESEGREDTQRPRWTWHTHVIVLRRYFIFDGNWTWFP